MGTDRRLWRGQCVRMMAVMMVAVGTMAGAVAMPQEPPSLMLPQNQVTRVSDHVYAIMGFPNIGIVVGNRATLVVDTGLGPRNGAIAAHEAQKLAKGPVLYLTTTHYHAEHAAGDNGFPENTILVRPIAQQKELEERGAAFVQMFSSRNAQMKELLSDTKFRTPDVTFEKELNLDLGGVTARLFWLGQAHTKGDEMIDVKPDSALISGDIVQNKMVPNLPDENASMKGWVDILAQLRPMKFKFIVPDHGALGDGSLIEQDFQFFSELQKRALERKKQGQSADEAGQALSAEFKTKFPDWQGLSSIPNVVKHVYAENP
jgi:glyoxylase-like metal-dependent hydrolase (beta-lactamase superfamily II)